MEELTQTAANQSRARPALSDLRKVSAAIRAAAILATEDIGIGPRTKPFRLPEVIDRIHDHKLVYSVIVHGGMKR